MNLATKLTKYARDHTPSNRRPLIDPVTEGVGVSIVAANLSEGIEYIVHNGAYRLEYMGHSVRLGAAIDLMKKNAKFNGVLPVFEDLLRHHAKTLPGQKTVIPLPGELPQFRSALEIVIAVYASETLSARGLGPVAAGDAYWVQSLF